MRLLIFDILDVLIPLAVGVAVFFVGKLLRWLPLVLRVGLVAIAIAVVVIGGLALARLLPPDFAFWLSWIGGGTVLLACMALFLLGFVWNVPKRSFSTSFLIALALLAACSIVVESSGRLWWRYGNADLWQRYPDQDGTLQQTSGATCSPTAAAMLLHKYGIRTSEGEMAYLAGTSLFGTDAHSIVRAIDRKVEPHGLHAIARHMDYDACLRFDAPFIAHVTGYSAGHALLVERTLPEYIEYADPADGKRGHMDRNEFIRIWDGTAIYAGTAQ